MRNRLAIRFTPPGPTSKRSAAMSAIGAKPSQTSALPKLPTQKMAARVGGGSGRAGRARERARGGLRGGLTSFIRRGPHRPNGCPVRVRAACDCACDSARADAPRAARPATSGWCVRAWPRPSSTTPPLLPTRNGRRSTARATRRGEQSGGGGAAGTHRAPRTASGPEHLQRGDAAEYSRTARRGTGGWRRASRPETAPARPGSGAPWRGRANGPAGRLTTVARSFTNAARTRSRVSRRGPGGRGGGGGGSRVPTRTAAAPDSRYSPESRRCCEGLPLGSTRGASRSRGERNAREGPQPRGAHARHHGLSPGRRGLRVRPPLREPADASAGRC